MIEKKQEQELINQLKINGIYEHYKSTHEAKKLYKVTNVVRHCDTLELMVIYQALYDCGDFGQVWARPISHFLGTIEINNQKCQRFTFVE